MRVSLCNVVLALIVSGSMSTAAPVALQEEAHVILVGNNLGSRMMKYGHFETELHLRYPDKKLTIRNMCDGGNTPGFRPHSARKNTKHWAFPGADKFNPNHTRGAGSGHNDTPDAWITRHKADVILAFFGYVKSFEGRAGLENYTQELDAFVKHTLAQKYNGTAAPKVVLVSPIAFQDLSATIDVPNGLLENVNLQIYGDAMRKVAAANKVGFVDLFTPTKKWFDGSPAPLTIDGSQLTDAGYAKLAPLIVNGAFGKSKAGVAKHRAGILAAVMEKNWVWHSDFKVPNGVHAYGRRYNPFGPKNYPMEFAKIRKMTVLRDQAIWAANQGKTFDLKSADAETGDLPAVETNFRGATTYKAPEKGAADLEIVDGFKIEQFASEKEFPNLANPVQMSFDNKGRLWVAVMPSYPHWRPGDAKPTDKLLIYEDTDNDGKADREIVYSDTLSIPIGFEFAPEGVYVSQGTDLILLRDLDGDDKADVKEIMLSGFDDHDTHHAIGAFVADPSGAFFMGEGVFLNSNVETSYGPVRGSDGGFFRYSPQRHRLERALQVAIPNPWGMAFDRYGQGFFLHTSGTAFCWMTPYRVKPQYGYNMRTKNLLTGGAARPTSGLEFVESRHFPDDMQGDVLYCNNIGFQGIKQHKMIEAGTGFTTEFRHDLISSKDRNFRPVDLEFAPDGSLYVIDWQNVLIGHMQHNARDPHRDHAHGRIYRITYPSRPLVKPASVDGASIAVLLDNLKLPEYRTRYRSRRELREHSAEKVLPAITTWVAALDKTDGEYDHHVLEALWATWGLNQVDESLLRQSLKSTDHRVRSAAVNVLHYNMHVSGSQALLMAAADDGHGRVRLETVSAASWIGQKAGVPVLDAVKRAELAAAPPAKKAVAAKKGGELRMKNSAYHVRAMDLGNAKVSSIEISKKGGILNLTEIEIMSGGKNIAKQAKATQSSIYSSKYGIEKMVDGDPLSLAHTKEGDKAPMMRFDFVEPVAISEVKITNRSGKLGARINGFGLIFRNGDKVVRKYTLKSAKKGSTVSVGGLSEWVGPAHMTALKTLNGEQVTDAPAEKVKTSLKGAAEKLYVKGHEIFNREGHCGTCHQPDGKGLVDSGFPPLAGTKWAVGDEVRLIKLTLKGLMGPIEVKGKAYAGHVPMTPFEGLLKDEEIAAVLTYVRNSFGNKASVVTPEAVKAVRASVKSRPGFYTPAELLKEHPH